MKVTGNLYKINSPAAKAYLWLLLHQEEVARPNVGRLDVSDADLAQALGVSQTTAENYRKELERNSARDSARKTDQKREILVPMPTWTSPMTLCPYFSYLQILIPIRIYSYNLSPGRPCSVTMAGISCWLVSSGMIAGLGELGERA